MSSRRGWLARARAMPRRRSSPCGSAAGGEVGDAGEGEQLEQLVAPARRPAGVVPRRQGGDLDVLPYREGAEQPRPLERARHAVAGAAIRLPVGRLDPADPDRSGGRPLEPRQGIDERRLARSVRPDQAEDLALLEVEVDALDRLDAGEVHRHTERFEPKRHRRHCDRCADAVFGLSRSCREAPRAWRTRGTPVSHPGSPPPPSAGRAERGTRGCRWSARRAAARR